MNLESSMLAVSGSRIYTRFRNWPQDCKRVLNGPRLAVTWARSRFARKRRVLERQPIVGFEPWKSKKNGWKKPKVSTTQFTSQFKFANRFFHSMGCRYRILNMYVCLYVVYFWGCYTLDIFLPLFYFNCCVPLLCFRFLWFEAILFFLKYLFSNSDRN
jgi:hypothetical protein